MLRSDGLTRAEGGLSHRDSWVILPQFLMWFHATLWARCTVMLVLGILSSQCGTVCMHRPHMAKTCHSVYERAHGGWHGGSGACTPASQLEGHRFDSRMGLLSQILALGGRSSPDLQCSGGLSPGPSVLRWAISRAFLCGVCMFSPCSQGVSSTKNPNRKTYKKNRTHVHP